MEERKIIDQESVRELWSFAVQFLGSLNVKPEQDIGDTLEVLLALKKQEDSLKTPQAWSDRLDLDGLSVHASARLKARDRRDSGVMDSLSAFAVHYLESLPLGQAQGFLQAMQSQRKTLLHFAVSLSASKDKGKLIGRKFGALHRSRELAVQFLYSMDTRPEQDFADALELFLMLDDVAQDDEPDVKARCRKIVSQVWQRQNEIDGVLLRVVTGWRPERMVSVDRAILRLMVLEGFMMKSLPVRSAISEAITLAGDFGTNNSPRFVNGVMHKAAKYFESKEAGDSDGIIPADREE